jgi:hypothetical protein
MYRCFEAVDPNGIVSSPVWGGVLAGVITAAQILALVGNPILLLPPPGAGLAWMIRNYFLNLQFKTTPYTAGSSLFLGYGNAPSGALAIMPTVPTVGFVTGAASRFIFGPGQSQTLNTGQAVAGVPNAGIYFGSMGPTQYLSGDSPIAYRLEYNYAPMQ